MPPAFAKSPDGILYVANGIDPVLRWDGLTTSMEPAGVEGPDSAVTVTGSGVGDIFGTIYGYARFIDRLGNVGNLSPVGTAYEAKGIERTITAAANTAPIVITTNAHSLQTGDKIVVEGVEGLTGANGTWIVTNLTADTFSLDGSSGNADYRSSGTWHRGVATINYSNLPVTDDPKIQFRQVFRTRHGDPNTVFLDIESTTFSTTSLSSTKTDAELVSGAALTDDTGDDLLLSRHGIPPSDKSVFAHHIDRMFALVDEEYNVGNVAVTNGSTAVTGIGTEFSGEFSGRYLWVSGGRRYYLISSVDIASQALTLSAAYEGATELYTDYSIRADITQRRSIRWSEAGLPESWLPTHEQPIQENPGSGDLRGAMSLDSWIYLLAESRIYRLSYQVDPLRDGFVFPDAKRGVLNQRCWVQVEDAAYLLDRQGIYAFQGNGHQEISQPIQDMFEREPDGAYQINWGASRWFHAAHDPVYETVKFFVCLDGDYLPHHAICYAYRYRRLWVEEYPVPIGAAAVGEMDGRAQLFLGSDHCRVLASGIGRLDGLDSGAGTVRGTVTSSGPTWVADTTAAFGGDLVNAPLLITGGKGKGQRRRIISVSGTTINVKDPWLISPNTTSTYQVGGVEYAYRTGNYRWLQRDSLQNRRIELLFEPTVAPSDMHLRVFQSQTANPELMAYTRTSSEGNGVASEVGSAYLEIDTTKETGYVSHSMSDRRGREVEGDRFANFEISGVANKDRVRIYQIGLYGMRK
jgi:hypothetical protein